MPRVRHNREYDRDRMRRQRAAAKEVKEAAEREANADASVKPEASQESRRSRVPARSGDGAQGYTPGKLEMQLVRQACNRQWPVPDEIRARTIVRTDRALDSEHERHRLMAANTFVAMDRLNLQREALDRGAGLGGDFTISDLVGEMERTAEAYAPEEPPHAATDGDSAPKR